MASADTFLSYEPASVLVALDNYARQSDAAIPGDLIDAIQSLAKVESKEALLKSMRDFYHRRDPILDESRDTFSERTVPLTLINDVERTKPNFLKLMETVRDMMDEVIDEANDRYETNSWQKASEPVSDDFITLRGTEDSDDCHHDQTSKVTNKSDEKADEGGGLKRKLYCPTDATAIASPWRKSAPTRQKRMKVQVARHTAATRMTPPAPPPPKSTANVGHSFFRCVCCRDLRWGKESFLKHVEDHYAKGHIRVFLCPRKLCDFKALMVWDMRKHMDECNC
jgi:hypothetical protein